MPLLLILLPLLQNLLLLLPLLLLLLFFRPRGALQFGVLSIVIECLGKKAHSMIKCWL